MKLSEQEIRVLGCLIEKSQATPEYYPMTVNGIVTACNQKTSREPVVRYSADDVEDSLQQLKEKSLCVFVAGSGRALKYAQRCGANGLGLSKAQCAVLSIMFLRGPQTAGEINSRSRRQFQFESLDDVQKTFESLMSPDNLFIEPGPRRSGQKEVRYRHLFKLYEDNVDEEQVEEAVPSLRHEVKELQQKVAGLEDENARLERRLMQVEETVAKLKEDLY